MAPSRYYQRSGLAAGAETTAALRSFAKTTILKYSFAEFFVNGDIADSLAFNEGSVAVIAEVAEKLTFTDSDEFDRMWFVPQVISESLIIRTSAAVKDGSSVVLDGAAPEYLFGVDLSAGTTGDSTIDASAEVGNYGMLLKGGSGKNTIKGTAGLDVIEGGKNDVLIGGAEVDIIVANDGKDSIEGGSGNDSIMLGTNLTFQDTVKGGDGTGDILSWRQLVQRSTTIWTM